MMVYSDAEYSDRWGWARPARPRRDQWRVFPRAFRTFHYYGPYQGREDSSSRDLLARALQGDEAAKQALRAQGLRRWEHRGRVIL